ncbi:nose resistant to fluoxetine protein 6-like [Ylistrum balloti]|uniref:nose resistant to fluoxetine protein 6-like n=1 Tax=Ylistrum balloti TaxID=509963 RepID=UPI0029058064|nr:nose resistant to fluoxetine protein 6-like [Ylistrum balloti]
MLVTIGTIVDLVVTFNERRQKSSNSYVILVEDNETTGRTSVLSNETSSSGQIQSQRLNPPQPNRGKICQVAVAFSIVTNTRKLLSTSTSSGHLTSLNGMRVLSMFWIILGHTYLFASLGMTVENSLAAVKIIQRFSFQAIINATVSVDTFFFMSGLLVTYLYLKNRQESTDSFNWVLFYFHRYWRLTPVYAFCIMIWGSLFFHTLRGPMAVWRSTPQTQALINECSKSWWANILYINNYYPYSGDINQQCMGWSWYLANDMQFYIISPIILILLYRYRKIGFAVCGGLIGACIFIRAMTAFEFGIHVPNQAVTKHKDNYYGQHAPLYNKMYTRIAPYIVGMLLGYALHKTNCRVRMSKVTVLTGWSVAIATGLSVVYGLYDYYYHSFNASLAVSVIYLAFNRFAWSVALAWVVFACATGYGGLVNSILSWSAWAPLGRLTYCAYLIHPMILEFFFFQPYAYIVSDVNMICYYLGLLVLTYMCAYIVSMAVEAPMLGLEKILIPLMEKAINTLVRFLQSFLRRRPD